MASAPPPSPPRVQFVVSGRFLILLLAAAALLGGGYHWYRQQHQAQARFAAPPYFINRGTAVMRVCRQCIQLGILKSQAEWKVGPAVEIPPEEQRWFLAAEDPPVPVNYAGVLMLPVHPAQNDKNPSFGFNRSQIVLVLYQGLERRPWIEQPPAQAPTPPSPVPEPAPQQQAEPDLTPSAALNITRTTHTSWRIEIPVGQEWLNTGIPLVVGQSLSIKPAAAQRYGQRYSEGFGGYFIGIGDYEYSVLSTPRGGLRIFEIELTEEAPFATGPDWLGSLYLRLPAHTSASFTLNVSLRPLDMERFVHSLQNNETRENHDRRHEHIRSRFAELLQRP